MTTVYGSTFKKNIQNQKLREKGQKKIFFAWINDEIIINTKALFLYG